MRTNTQISLLDIQEDKYKDNIKGLILLSTACHYLWEATNKELFSQCFHFKWTAPWIYHYWGRWTYQLWKL